jgi:eukaryotic translation initiation factor 2C
LTTTTMVVGADVTRPGCGSMTDTDSVAAIVASEDDAFNRYPASFRCQESKMEMVKQFDEMPWERLEHWRKFNKLRSLKGPDGKKAAYPTSVVIYRDRVSESQFEQVVELENPQIQMILKQKYSTVQQEFPKILILSVQKRHHTRVYPTERADAQKFDNNGNPLPGLIVDRDVTYADKYNCFQQSHYCIISTARPAHYVVLVDTINALVDIVQKAVREICFLLVIGNFP